MSFTINEVNVAISGEYFFQLLLETVAGDQPGHLCMHFGAQTQTATKCKEE